MAPTKKGFSLVLSLTIMALLVLVVLCVAGFLNLESRIASVRMEMAKAQLNAIASGRLAIGHLQMLAGPDQRVTTRADIFDGGASNSYLSMPALTLAQQSSFLRKRNWTGVWCTGGADASKPRDWNPQEPDERIFLGWLVSAQAAKATDPTLIDENELPFVLPDSTLANSTGVGGKGKPLITGTSLAAMITPWTAARFIPLVDLGTIGYTGRPIYAAGEDPNKVELPPAPFPGATAKSLIGYHAWWVGDCGIKARHNLADPVTLTSTEAELPGLTDFDKSLRTQAGRHAIELMGSGVVTTRPFKDVPALWDADVRAAVATGSTNTMLLQHVVSRSMLRNWANKFGGAAADKAVSDALAQYYHDVTHVSYGVLSDTLNGGLRRDLSVAFELPFTEYAGLAEFNDSPGESGDINGKGANWNSGFNLAAMMGINASNTPSFTEWGNPERKLGFIYELQIPSALYTGRAGSQNNPVSLNVPPIMRGPTWDLLRNYYRLYKREYESLEPNQRRGQLDAAADAWLARGAEPFSYSIGVPSTLRTTYRGQPGHFAFRANAAMTMRKNATGSGPYYPENATVALPTFSNYDTSRVGNNGPIPQHTSMKLTPSVIRTAFIFRLVWTGTTAADAKLGVAMDPRVTLHNPYNVPLELNGMGLTVGKWYSVNFRLYRSDTLASIGTIILQPSYTLGRGFTFRILNNGGTLENPTSNIRLEPGEIRTYCASSATEDIIYNDVTAIGEIKNIPGIFDYSIATGQRMLYRLPAGSTPDPASFAGTPAIRVAAGFGYDAANDTTGTGFLYEVGQLDFHLAQNKLDNGTNVFAAQRTWYGYDNNPEVDMGDEHLVHRIQFLPRGLTTRSVTSGDILINTPESQTAFAMVDVKARGWDDTTVTNPRTDTASPLFVSHRAQLMDYRLNDGDANAPAGWTLGFNNANAVVSQFEMTGARNNSYWGKSASSGGGGQTSVILYQVPTRPLLALAGLGSVDYTHIDTQPGLTIGNSYCPPGLSDSSKLLEWPVISSGAVNGTPALTAGWGYVRAVRYDATWASNHALYDRYFFSGAYANEASSYGSDVPKFDPSQPETLQQLFNDLQTGLKVLANKRMVWVGTPASTISDFRNPAKTAKTLLHDGTFNINSTSKDAWKALLAGLRGQKLPGATKAAKDLSPFSRFDKVVADHDAANTATRFRALTDAEIDALAEQIVLQVRSRGPFMSLSDFVNRRLLEDKPTSNNLHLKGALQAAIDATDINRTNAPYSGTFSADTNRHPTAKALSADNTPSAGSAQNALGAPGLLLQSDILNAAGASLSARSDTFVIRAYGESADNFGRPGAGAWLELTVQRMPEMIVPDDNEPNTSDSSYRSLSANSNPSTKLYMEKFKPNSAVKKANRFLGRRFKVIGMRWLSPNEV